MFLWETIPIWLSRSIWRNSCIFQIFPQSKMHLNRQGIRVSLPSRVTSYSRQEFELCRTQFCSTKRALEWKNPQEKREIRGKKRRKWRESVVCPPPPPFPPLDPPPRSSFHLKCMDGEGEGDPFLLLLLLSFLILFFLFPICPPGYFFFFPFPPSGFTWGRGNREEGKRGRECFSNASPKHGFSPIFSLLSTSGFSLSPFPPHFHSPFLNGRNDRLIFRSRDSK